MSTARTRFCEFLKTSFRSCLISSSSQFCSLQLLAGGGEGGGSQRSAQMYNGRCVQNFIPDYNYTIMIIINKQTFSALIIFVSAAHAALFYEIMSGAHASAHFSNRERRSCQRSRKISALILRSRKTLALILRSRKILALILRSQKLGSSFSEKIF